MDPPHRIRVVALHIRPDQLRRRVREDPTPDRNDHRQGSEHRSAEADDRCPIPPVQRCVVAPKRQTPEEGRRNRRGGDHRCGASPVALERRSLFVEAMLGGLERKLVNGCAIDCHGESLRTGADSAWMPAGDAGRTVARRARLIGPKADSWCKRSSLLTPSLTVRLRGRDSNPDYLIQSQASYH